MFVTIGDIFGPLLHTPAWMYIGIVMDIVGAVGANGVGNGAGRFSLFSWRTVFPVV
ncbi:predicted protein [Histoplasma mississippiense (nom. inval.)]|uniref:predicted protein n=1 Tax=Ajellomyces capsulatus (strain NAm1 / WU24) TaxID=2059318 RepID=UPI000157B8BA|nr:predicted protein [Histoplasma mississippiense (nom. inval.)]EDN03742.1 predicted protein [Histoplasma mississippiense (nom. inval.)]